MEVAIVGDGEVVIRFIDPKGRTLMQEKVAISGSPTVQGRRTMALSVETANGAVPVAPVLVRQSNAKQRVTFDGEPASRFTRQRCGEIGCPIDVANDAERGCAGPPAQAQGSVVLSDDQALARLIKDGVGGKSESGS